MLNPSLLPVEYVEQAPIGCDYSVPHRGEYSFEVGDYLVTNPPYSVAVPANILYVKGLHIVIDYGGSQLFSSLDEKSRIADEFASLARHWRNDTRGSSSLSDIFMHPCYQRIMAMGKAALPFILRDLQENSGHWFHALRFIAGKDIAAGAETIPDARSSWLEWGYRNGYL